MTETRTLQLDDDTDRDDGRLGSLLPSLGGGRVRWLGSDELGATAIESPAALMLTHMRDRYGSVEAKPSIPQFTRPKVRWLGQKGTVGMVWKGDSADPAVKTLQSQINTQLTKLGYYGIGVDGKLGPATCGAIAMLGDTKNSGQVDWTAIDAGLIADATSQCKGWTMPTKKGETKPDKPTSKLKKEDYALPWGEPNLQTGEIQGQVNVALEAIDYYGIPVSGVLDAQTCGALKLLQEQTGVNWMDAYGANCQSFITPKKKPPKGGGAGPVVEPTPPPPPPATKTTAKKSSTGWLLLATGAAGAMFLALRPPPIPPRAAERER